VKPVLFVTNLVPPDRAGAFAALHARVPLELALFGGRSHHATAGVEDPGVPHRRVRQRDVHALAASGDYAAVVCGTAGRVALPAAWRGARRARVPFVLWSALWAPLATPAHLLARPLLRRIHRTAQAVVAYGPHVAAFARREGARHVLIAPQAVDNDFWSAPATPVATDAAFTALFVGRPAREKGLDVLLRAWREAAIDDGRLLLAGGRAPKTSDSEAFGAHGVRELGLLAPEQLRNFYAAADVLVMPSIATRGFREPWGLVANEAMNQRCAIIATDAVGAAAGGLVRHEHSGLVVRNRDPSALAATLRRLHDDRALRARLGANGARDVAAFTFDAWAAGFEQALVGTTPRRPDW
jgi:glycosyltransferase involved in cell wall biosynthesis